MFGAAASNSAFRPGSLFSSQAPTSAVGAFGTPAVGVGATGNPNRDLEVSSPPEDSIQALKFSPATVPQNFLVSGSWDHVVRIWEIKQDGSSEPKSQKTMDGPVLEVAFSDDGTKIFAAGADKTVKLWDLASDQFTQVAAHDAPIKTCHWMKSPSFSCLITGSWDKQLRFWDLRSPAPIHTIQVGERVYCADVVYPMAVVGTAGRGIHVYRLEGTPQLYKKIESQLKFQHRCCSIFTDKVSNAPTGFAFGSIEGRVAIQYVDPATPKDNFTFKCHRSPELVNGYQDIYAINDIAFHPQHGTLATVGSDGRYSYWDKDARTKLKTSEKMDQAITRCCFNKDGTIFAYSLSYDWSKGHEGYNAQQKSKIYLKDCFEDMRQKAKK